MNCKGSSHYIERPLLELIQLLQLLRLVSLDLVYNAMNNTLEWGYPLRVASQNPYAI